MELGTHSDCSLYVKFEGSGSFKLSGRENFVNSKYRELSKRFEEKEKERMKLFVERLNIACILWLVSVVLVLLIFVISFVGVPIKDYLLIFVAGIMGLSFRAIFVGKDVKGDKTAKDLYKAYFVVYPFVLFTFSFLALSVFTRLGYEGWQLYGVTLPIGFFAGVLGLGILDKIHI